MISSALIQAQPFFLLSFIINDFVSGTGKIILGKSVFPSLNSAAGNGFSIPNEFAIVSSNAAATSTAEIVYNSGNGSLFHNSNGSVSGFGDGGQFATLTGAPTLVASDFGIVA